MYVPDAESIGRHHQRVAGTNLDGLAAVRGEGATSGDEVAELLLHDLPVIPLWDYTAAGGVGPGVTAQLTWNGLADFTQITKGDVTENTKG